MDFFSMCLPLNTSQEVPGTYEGRQERGRDEDEKKVWIVHQTDAGSWVTGKGTSVVGERRRSFEQHTVLRTDFYPKVLRSH